MSQRTPSRVPDPRPEQAPGSPWRPLTRRAFVTALGAAAVALAVDQPSALRALRGAGASEADVERPRPPPSTTGTRWIGHC